MPPLLREDVGRSKLPSCRQVFLQKKKAELARMIYGFLESLYLASSLIYTRRYLVRVMFMVVCASVPTRGVSSVHDRAISTWNFPKNHQPARPLLLTPLLILIPHPRSRMRTKHFPNATRTCHKFTIQPNQHYNKNNNNENEYLR